MSQENVQIVRRVFDAVARREVDPVLEAYDPDVVYDFSESGLDPLFASTIYRGYAGMRSLFKERFSAWETIDDDCRELIEAGDRVISVVATRGRGRSSGAEVELTHYGLWTFRDGRIVRVDWFRTLDEARRAAD